MFLSINSGKNANPANATRLWNQSIVSIVIATIVVGSYEGSLNSCQNPK